MRSRSESTGRSGRATSTNGALARIVTGRIRQHRSRMFVRYRLVTNGPGGVANSYIRLVRPLPRFPHRFPAPGRFSMTTGWPESAESFSAISRGECRRSRREEMGTTILMARFGNRARRTPTNDRGTACGENKSRKDRDADHFVAVLVPLHNGHAHSAARRPHRHDVDVPARLEIPSQNSACSGVASGQMSRARPHTMRSMRPSSAEPC